MQQTIMIQKEEYEELKQKAAVLDDIMETDNLTLEELQKVRKAERSKKMTEKEFFSRYAKLAGSHVQPRFSQGV